MPTVTVNGGPQLTIKVRDPSKFHGSQEDIVKALQDAGIRKKPEEEKPPSLRPITRNGT